MAKRFIGIDIDSRHLRVAIAASDKGQATLVSATSQPYADREELLQKLRKAVGGPPRYGDRLAAALPAGEGFARWLSFPFADLKKIEAALSFELSAQLPVPEEDCTADFQKPLAAGGAFTVAAAAGRNEAIRPLVETFEEAGLPLQVLDLAPFAYAAGLRGALADGLLVSLTEAETTLALVLEGRPSSYRLLPAASGGTEQGLVPSLLREASALQRAAGRDGLPFHLIGSGAAPALVEALRAEGVEAAIPDLSLEGRPLEPEMLPVAALALRAAIPEKEREFNFRKGAFALSSEWSALKNGLIAAAVLLTLSAASLAGAAYLNYSHKADRTEGLKQEMVRVYKKVFPKAKTIVDVPLQMQSGISELRKRSRTIGAAAQSSPLAILQEISRKLPEEITIDIRDWNYSPETVRMEGHTTSFDAINQISKSLEQSPLFHEAQISDAKMSLDGRRVDFRITLALIKEKAEQ
ncbi:MAG: hypothetical protein C0617_04440 [Desulfuromonas sp.]|uniref:GspL/Epsl periplasmic domain-containing protein n=1 Tax=Desulfuromonas sp. TaxID=892 RepID=UPI000CC7EEEC|nr:GspL/Epsl periplasmic domain-containing protein [Desulfuromonas sp.]PLX85326.1 MAG: hypothetical protein C0617_04440 [Desulfuromonas sp.]